MIRAHSAAQVREAEAPLLAAGEPLMQRAARALADRAVVHLRQGTGGQAGDAHPLERTLERALAGPRVLVLAGAGSNGGDGLHAAALLRQEGIAADAILVAERHHAEGAAALQAAGGTLHPLAGLDPDRLAQLLASTELVLDAILGIGGRAVVPTEQRPVLEAVRTGAVPVLAVDLPSFVDATTAEAAPESLTATETVTFGALKSALLLPGGAERSGRIHLVDLGITPHLPETPALLRLEDQDVRVLFPRPVRDATKYSRGVVALAAGSEQYPGAAVLAASGAARAGAGMVRCLAPPSVLDLVLQARPEVVGHPVHPTTLDPASLHLEDTGRIGALVVGPGLEGEDLRARAGVSLLTCGGGKIDRGVLDAGALDAITPEHRFDPDVVLTPHAGEAARLARRLGADPDLPAPRLAAELASLTGATVLLKGAITVIAPGDGGPMRSQEDATAQLATAGTGDVLAGVLGTLLAAGLTGPDAASLAAILHGRAGRLASRDGLVPLVALDVAGHLPAAVGTILAAAPQ